MQLTMKNLIFISFIVLFVSCNETQSIFTTDIKDILSNPHKFKNKEVTIRGRVTDAFNFLGLKYFKLKDETGEIYVIPKNIVPNIADEVTIRGYVDQYFKIGDLQLTVIIEK